MNVILSVLFGIIILLSMILLLRIPAFISLLVASILTGLFVGLDSEAIINTVQTGMGSTLGFVAVVVGLGAMFGAILEKSNGAEAIAGYLTRAMGEKKAPFAMLITGFVVAIPVFFDVAFIILIPVLYALQKKSGKSLLAFAIPLLAGLATTHTFIPPTPGPVAVADIIKADLGWVILVGFLAGVPTAIISGLVFGKYISKKIFIQAKTVANAEIKSSENLPPISLVFGIILIPIFLILCGTMIKSGLLPVENAPLENILILIGHPFSALILANLTIWYVLGIRRGFSSKELFRITSKSMEPAGTIILLTGAGGVFKQVLITTGAGEIIANTFSDWGFPILLFGFMAACAIRILQGSATVAMITAAGLVAPVLVNLPLSGGELAALVIAIASGASILSHVNDSGFWLVKEYLGMDEKQTFRSWSMMTTLLALTGFLASAILFYIF
ncbi:MAG: gluconate transporter [Saprospiraceae bacterium]|nr:gluconate transporter [Saprospiraceae bacterium]MCB9324147.1 gluconate transporter [Lewinellaceae bacterium]